MYAAGREGRIVLAQSWAEIISGQANAKQHQDGGVSTAEPQNPLAQP